MLVLGSLLLLSSALLLYSTLPRPEQSFLVYKSLAAPYAICFSLLAITWIFLHHSPFFSPWLEFDRDSQSIRWLRSRYRLRLIAEWRWQDLRISQDTREGGRHGRVIRQHLPYLFSQNNSKQRICIGEIDRSSEKSYQAKQGKLWGAGASFRKHLLLQLTQWFQGYDFPVDQKGWVIIRLP